MPLACKVRVAKDAFAEYGFGGNLPQELRAETGRILSRWGDAGWGQLVADDKHRGHFRDALIEAVVEMVQDRWKPDPPPEWLTCVPSRAHANLVPGFARRLASALELPFMPVVSKTRHNEPQKVQQNRFYQCRNLDGAFRVDGLVPRPVLLVDDIGFRMDDDGRRSAAQTSWQWFGLARCFGHNKPRRLGCSQIAKLKRFCC